MRKILSVLGVIAAITCSTYIYSRQQHQSTIGAKTPSAPLNVIDIQNELLAMADAERRHFALAGKYVVVQELIPSGEIENQGPCSYDTLVSRKHFEITATCFAQSASGKPTVLKISKVQTQGD